MPCPPSWVACAVSPSGLTKKPILSPPTIAALKGLRHVVEVIERFRHGKSAVVFGLEILLPVGPRKPVLAIGPAHRITPRRQRPIVRRVLRPLGIADHGCRHVVVHADSFL